MKCKVFSAWLSMIVFFTGLAGLDAVCLAGSQEWTDNNMGAAADDTDTRVLTGVQTWYTSSDLTVGGSGEALIILDEGPSLTAHQNVYLASGADGTGEVLVARKGSSLTVLGQLFVGQRGTGRLVVSGGAGLVTADSVLIGFEDDSFGEVILAGQDTLWVADGDVLVGGLGTEPAGDGTLVISDAAAAVMDETLWISPSGEVIVHDNSTLGATHLVNYGQVTASNSNIATRYVTNVEDVQVSGGQFIVSDYLINYEQMVFEDGADVRIHELDNYGRLGLVDSTLLGSLLDNHEELVAIDSTITVKELVNYDEMTLQDTTVHGALGHHTDAIITVEGTVDFHSDVYGGGSFLGAGNAVFHGLYRPANSIASPTFDGDFTLAATSTLSLQITADPAVHDTVTVGGVATFEEGSTLQLVKADDEPLLAGTEYTLITADGGMDDQGLVVALNEAGGWVRFDNAVLGNELQVTVTSTDLVSLAANDLQRGPARGIERDFEAGVDPGSDYAHLIADLQVLDVAGVQAMLDQLSPAPLANAAPTHRHATQAYQANLANHLRHPQPAGRFGFALSEHASASTAMQAMPRAGASRRQWALTGRGFGAFDRVGSRGDRHGYRANTGGGLLAADYRFDEDWRLGLALGYAQTRLDQSRGRGHGTIDNLRGGPYLSYEPGDAFIDTGLSYGYSNIRLDRHVARNGTTDTLDSRHDGHDLAAFLSTGYHVRLADRTTLTPVAALQHVYLHERGYAENGPGAARLEVDSRNSHSLNSSLGVRLRHEWTADGRRWAPEVGVAWEHEWLARDNDITARFAEGSSRFTTRIDGLAGSSLHAGGGVTLLFDEQTSAFVRYDGRFHEHNAHSHAFSAGLNIRF